MKEEYFTADFMELVPRVIKAKSLDTEQIDELPNNTQVIYLGEIMENQFEKYREYVIMLPKDFVYVRVDIKNGKTGAYEVLDGSLAKLKAIEYFRVGNRVIKNECFWTKIIGTPPFEK